MLCLVLGVACSQSSRLYFAPESIIKTVDDHTVAIAVYYTMSEEEWQNRMANTISIHGEPMVDVSVTQEIGDKPIKCIAYIGSGKIISDPTRKYSNKVLTVDHLFNHGDNTYSMTPWVIKKGDDKFCGATVLARSEHLDFHDDYAVLAVRTQTWKMPGLKIASKEIKKGERVILSGSVGGSAFFTRFCIATSFRYFFKRTEDGRLHLSFWNEFEFLPTLYPGGGGDSGSSVCNLKGEIVGVIYCGVELHAENYLFSNPLSVLKDFLKKSKLGHLGT